MPSIQPGVKQWNNNDDTLAIVGDLAPFHDVENCTVGGFLTRREPCLSKPKGSTTN